MQNKDPVDTIHRKRLDILLPIQRVKNFVKEAKAIFGRAAPRVSYIYTMSPVFIEYDLTKIHYASSTQNLQAISTEKQYYVEDKRHITLIACLFFSAIQSNSSKTCRKTDVKICVKGVQRGEFPSTMHVSSYHTSGIDDADTSISEMIKSNDFSPIDLVGSIYN